VISVDPIESALRRAGIDSGQPTGLAAYVVAETVANGVLGLDQDVIVDAVNGVRPARQQWRDLSARHDVPLRVLEVVCSDIGSTAADWGAGTAAGPGARSRPGRTSSAAGRSTSRGTAPTTGWCWTRCPG